MPESVGTNLGHIHVYSHSRRQRPLADVSNVGVFMTTSYVLVNGHDGNALADIHQSPTASRRGMSACACLYVFAWYSLIGRRIPTSLLCQCGIADDSAVL